MGQLDANLAAHDVTLSADQIASLDGLTQPTLNLPADLLKNLSLNLAHAGATVNSEPSISLSPLPSSQCRRGLLNDVPTDADVLVPPRRFRSLHRWPRTQLLLGAFDRAVRKWVEKRRR
jgi:hypothetical protein